MTKAQEQKAFNSICRQEGFREHRKGTHCTGCYKRIKPQPNFIAT